MNLKQRLQAGLVHLSASCLVAAAALILLVWYPAPLADAQGVSPYATDTHRRGYNHWPAGHYL